MRSMLVPQHRLIARRIVLVVTTWAVVASLGPTVLWAATRNDRTTSVPAQNEVTLTNGASPLLQARATTVAQAQEAVSFRIPVPDTSTASRSTLTRTWVNRGLRQVALIFSGGKLTITMWPVTYKNPLLYFRTFIAESHAKAAIKYLHGRPVLVISPHTDRYHSNPAWVEYVRNGIDINVYSHSYGTATLLADIKSME